jgi:hypothetical protein
MAHLAASLSTLRAEVEALADVVAERRRSAHDDVAALERRRRDLEARIAQSTLVQAELRARAEALQTAAAARDDADDVRRAPVLHAFDALLAHVDRVPFRPVSRRERIVQARRLAEAASPEQGAALAWPIVLDEARLLSTSGRARQPITLGSSTASTPLLVEVAHVGALVFWKAKDGRTGFAALPVTGAASFVEVTEPEGRQRLLLLFEALRRESPEGTFLVPNPTQSVRGTP